MLHCHNIIPCANEIQCKWGQETSITYQLRAENNSNNRYQYLLVWFPFQTWGWISKHCQFLLPFLFSLEFSNFPPASYPLPRSLSAWLGPTLPLGIVRWQTRVADAVGAAVASPWLFFCTPWLYCSIGRHLYVSCVLSCTPITILLSSGGGHSPVLLLK